MNLIQQLTEDFTGQLRRAVAVGNEIEVNIPAYEIKNVVIAGLGGSGIGGSIAHALLYDELKVPVEIIKSYDIPRYVDENTLFIASSYSGNTEETLAVVYKAIAKGARIACITSGGKLHELALSKGYDVARIPVEVQCPRANLGYSFVQLLYLLMSYHLIGDHYKADLNAAIELLDAEKGDIKFQAKLVAARLQNKLPIIYADAKFGAVATRFQQQINENAKQFCHVNVFPEMNHNELVGWVNPPQILEDAAVVMLQSTFNYERNAMRMEISKPVFHKLTNTVMSIEAHGNSLLQHFLYLIHLTDWVSYYLAELNGVDAYEINVINHLKNELAKV